MNVVVVCWWLLFDFMILTSKGHSEWIQFDGDVAHSENHFALFVFGEGSIERTHVFTRTIQREASSHTVEIIPRG